jgi:MarR family transcriptional regulator, organic hydroperoxide resistance regulator
MAAITGGGYGFTLLKAAQVWRTEATEVLRAHELTVPQFLVVMALYRQARHGWDALTQSEVATRLGMDANTTSQIVRALERRGLLTRTAHPDDARARALALTPDGIERGRDASASARALNDLFFSAVAPEQLTTLGDILDTLTTASEARS